AWAAGFMSIPADLLGIPVVSCGGLWARSEEQWREVRQILSVWRRICGLPDDPEGARIFPHGALVTMPMSYVVPGTHVPQSAVFIRPGLFDTSEGKHLPAWLGNTPSRPLVAMTLGSVYAWPRGSVFQLVLEALAHEPITLVLVVGKNFDPATLGPQPANVHVEGYIPFAQLFPLCDLVVSHGGWSTVLTALACGVPQLVLPVEMEEDHHGNAERVVAAGAGRAIVYWEEPLTAPAIRAAALDILSTPAYRENAERVQREIEALPGPETAVPLIERIVAEYRAEQPTPAAVASS
ncbi:MAG TPA: nucleotide disphospho-sugar-binding domain-containing protein, partial [Herpetosiphonaceae bacterium]|nr:nucleotide disphospho-sugar-binding domain-containing protein [Herpetosiphonaceae bacterium]